MAANMIPQQKAADPMSSGFLAALFAALQGDCTCKTCEIMRKIARSVQDQFLQG